MDSCTVVERKHDAPAEVAAPRFPQGGTQSRGRRPQGTGTSGRESATDDGYRTTTSFRVARKSPIRTR
jgi:hypothetical protein